MVKSRKIVCVAVLSAFAFAAVSAQEVSFENEVSTDIVNISITDDDTDSKFAGFENKTTAEYTSEKLDMGLVLKFSLTQEDDDSIRLGSDSYVDDYWVEFRPIDMLGIGFHKGQLLEGAFLPCLDDQQDAEIEAGNLRNDFGVFVRPVDGLVISAGFDFDSFFNKDDTDPLINAGAEYKYEEMFAVGAMFRNIVSDDRSIGVYASYTGLEVFTFNAGYTNNGEIEDFNVVGDFINAAVMFESDAFALNVDAAFSLDSDDNTTNDLYTAVLAGYQVNDALAVKLYGAFTTDFDNDDTWVFTVKPYVEYAINEHNAISGGVCVGISKPEKTISFPVSWVYTY